MFEKTAPSVPKVPQRIAVQINIGLCRLDETDDRPTNVMLVMSHGNPTLIVLEDGSARLVRPRQNQKYPVNVERMIYVNDTAYKVDNPEHNLSGVLKLYEEALAAEEIQLKS